MAAWEALAFESEYARTSNIKTLGLLFMKNFLIPCLGLMLTGCSSIDIVQYKDEFTKQNVCKLDEFKFHHETIVIRTRTTFMSLTKLSDDNVLVTLKTSLHGNFPYYPEGAPVEITVTNHDGSIETFKYTGFDKTNNHWVEPIPGYGVAKHWTSSFKFEIKKAQLVKIINAPQATFSILLPEYPLITDFNEKDKLALKTFIQSCY